MLFLLRSSRLVQTQLLPMPRLRVAYYTQHNMNIREHPRHLPGALFKEPGSAPNWVLSSTRRLRTLSGGTRKRIDYGVGQFDGAALPCALVKHRFPFPLGST